MSNLIRAVYENGVLRPIGALSLAERAEVDLLILDPDDDLTADGLALLAQNGGAFDFLADDAEDIYRADEGEELEPGD
jgi:predicted DNA-binding antitoxin AbrB/MazE fold protein